MKYEFEWRKVEGAIEPQCTTDLVSSQGIDVISCLLTDSGGLTLEHSISWIDECLDSISRVKEGTISCYSWDRESWAADISLSEVTVYSLLDEDYFVRLGRGEFEVLLRHWRAFLASGPNGSS
ncbi:hypothetical protein [Saccharospirillum impatiens]|uniref:hypothetical protein n=1 Tax=Saccharospirillum impatiens TaxID=169438 RepID=UPI00146A67FD|nr:hypothetical protein [Saccharospirillum impatiens]